MAWVRQRITAFSSAQVDSDSSAAFGAPALVALIVDEAVDLLQFRTQLFGQVEILVPRSDFGWTSKITAEHRVIP